MVEEEDRVVRGRVEVLHLRGTTTEPVTGAVNTELVVADEALHLGLEVLDIGLTKQELSHIRVGVVAGAKEDVQVTDEATGVEVIVVLHIVIVRAVKRSEVAEVDARERTRVDTSSTSSRRECHVHQTKVGIGASVNENTITTHRELITVENLALVRCVGVTSPVPVRKVTSVTACVDEIVLPLPDVVAVPGKEVGGDMDIHRHVDVGGNVFVVTADNTWSGCAALGRSRSLLKAHDGIGEALAVLVRHLPELCADTGRLEGAVTVEPTFLDALDGDLISILESFTTLDLGDGVVVKLGDVGRRE